ncbi:MAG: right-handed parallel beta-helix repeat-containing protein [Pseudomonadota bacterium]|nr:right-handed parallel beta-helix repeat-containing protein [Pseudomonadota bacterium]
MRHRCIGSRLALLLLAGGLAPQAALADASCTAESVRWAGMSNRLYVSGDVRCTLTELKALAPVETPLQLVDPAQHIWLLGANLILDGGATLVLDGVKRGGDVNELRLKSNNDSDPTAWVEVRAQHGTLLIRSTKVTSWDEAAGGPDLEYDTGRAFVRAVSYLDVDGTTARESRMDVIDSEIAYLGYYAAESYGLVWKVRATTPDVFDEVDVLGDVKDSFIHDNYFGMYTYGAFGMNVINNEVYNNIQYGIDPHDDSDMLVFEENFTHDNGNHGFICSMRCDGLTVRHNTSKANVGTGFMLHRAVQDTVVEFNVAEGNTDAGFAIMDSHQNIVRDNIARGNKYGVRLSVGASENVIENNQLTDNGLYGIYMYQGTDLPTINDGCPADNVFAGNVIARSGDRGIRASYANRNEFLDNTFRESTTSGAFLLDSIDNVFEGNDMGGGYILLEGLSPNTVTDSEFASVMLKGGDAVMAFNDTTGRIFDNDVGLLTAVTAEGSSLTLTSLINPGIMSVDALALSVLPVSGQLSVDVSSWAPPNRTWTVTSDTATSATFTVGELTPGARQVLWVDGAREGSIMPTAEGEAHVTVDLVVGTRTFALKEVVGIGPIEAGIIPGARPQGMESTTVGPRPTAPPVP